MRVMGLWYPAKIRTGLPSQAEMDRMGALIQEMFKAGVMEATGGWDPASPSKIVRKSGDMVTVTDGPFSETKEVVGGYAIFKVKDWDEALKWTKRFIEIAGDGYSEMRELHGN